MTNLNKNHQKAFSLVEISIVILIIGLLIAGISKASDMIFDANIKTGRALTKGAKVGRMPNLVLWLETTATESLLDKERFNASPITVWRDINVQSTSKFIFKNTGTPTYVEEGQNNLPGIGTISAANYFLPYSTEISTTVLTYPATQIFSSGANATIFMVFKPKSVTADLLSFCSYSSPTFTCAAGSQVKLGLTSGKINFDFTSSASANVQALTTADYSSRSLIIVSAEKDSAGQKIAVNGAVATLTAVATNASAAVPVFNGTFRVGGVNAAGVELYEIIVFASALSDLDRQSVEAYLGKKYNIPMTKAAL